MRADSTAPKWPQKNHWCVQCCGYVEQSCLIWAEMNGSTSIWIYAFNSNQKNPNVLILPYVSVQWLHSKPPQLHVLSLHWFYVFVCVCDCLFVCLIVRCWRSRAVCSRRDMAGKDLAGSTKTGPLLWDTTHTYMLYTSTCTLVIYLYPHIDKRRL